MRTLFNELEEIREFVTIDISGNFKTIKPYLVEAHKFVLKALDQATFTSLLNYVEDNSTLDTDLVNLLEYAQRALANFAYAVSADRLGVYVGENGILEFSNQNLEPLSPEKLKNIKSEFFSAGYNALEMLIIFIKENEATYPEAYAFLFNNTFFVSTAADLNSILFTDVANRDFFDMKPKLFLIEKEIEGIITPELVATIKAGGTLSPANAEMLVVIKEAEACLAYGYKFKSEEHNLRGRQLLENLDTLYNTSIAAEIETWENEGKRIYVFK